MRFNKTICAIVIASLAILEAGAQKKHYYTGYIINSTGDTLNGFFLKRNYFQRQNYCAFSETGGSRYNYRSYVPSEVTAYYLEQPNIYYKAFPISKPNGQEKQIFAEGLELGAVDLYLNRGIYNGDNLILNKGNLTYDVSIDINDMQTSRGILKSVLVNCKEIDAGIFNVTNSIPSFTHLINQYNHCIDSSSDAYSNKYKSTLNVDLGFYAGYSFSKMPFQITKYYPLFVPTDSVAFPTNDTSYYYSVPTEINPMLNAGIIFSLSCPALIGNLSFDFGLGYLYGQSRQKLDNYQLTPTDSITGYTSVDVHFLSIPLLLKWEFLSKKKFSPYIEGGYLINIPLTDFKILNTTEIDPPTTGYDNIASFQTVSNNNFTIGLGLDYNQKNGHSYFFEVCWNKMFKANLPTEYDFDESWSLDFRIGYRL
jgi:hypothetical protein